jgi:hypothetical protein
MEAKPTQYPTDRGRSNNAMMLFPLGLYSVRMDVAVIGRREEAAVCGRRVVNARTVAVKSPVVTSDIL